MKACRVLKILVSITFLCIHRIPKNYESNLRSCISGFGVFQYIATSSCDSTHCALIVERAFIPVTCFPSVARSLRNLQSRVAHFVCKVNVGKVCRGRQFALAHFDSKFNTQSGTQVRKRVLIYIYPIKLRCGTT